MTDACDLRFDFVGFTARRLGVSRQEIEATIPIPIHAAATAMIYGDHAKQERLDGQEPYEGRARQRRLVCA
jgi:hypothetical protein